MASEHQQQTHDKMFGGVDSTTRPHLVEDDSWIEAHNMVAINTFFAQVPPKVLVGNGSPGLLGIIIALFAIPAGTNPSNAMVALTTTGAFIVKFENDVVTFERMYLENFQVFNTKLQPVNGTLWQ